MSQVNIGSGPQIQALISFLNAYTNSHPLCEAVITQQGEAIYVATPTASATIWPQGGVDES